MHTCNSMVCVFNWALIFYDRPGNMYKDSIQNFKFSLQ